MREEYDFSNAIKNPYAKPDKRPVTIRLDVSIIEYFKALSIEVQMPYQTLINSLLAECGIPASLSHYVGCEIPVGYVEIVFKKKMKYGPAIYVSSARGIDSFD